ncbi:SUKH-3 domain-containing protein [Kitasatospora sp. NPDC058170]|uniref:SUKH-3 domain-containing protein n=1 Tax=Kitasatospora sp. NPDC058170 TaxID=3346364 RepID=UPI0036D87923
MPRFSPETESVLLCAGWTPGRRVDLSDWKTSVREFIWHAAAENFLSEFGGLRVDISGPGVTCAREPFEFDPELAIGEGGRFAELSESLGHNFFPLGEIGRGEFFLAIDEEGVIYLLGAGSKRHGKAELALENLITGIAPKEIVSPF